MPAFKPPFPRVQFGHPLTPGLAYAWEFWEKSGPNLHNIVNNQAATISGATWNSTELVFAGGADTVPTEKVFPTAETTFTLSVIATQTGAGRYAVSQWQTNTGMFLQNVAGDLTVFRNAGAVFAKVGGWVTGVRTHVVVTYSPTSKWVFYIDGLVLGTNGAAYPDFSTNIPFRVSDREDGDRAWVGGVGSVKIWIGRELSAVEVAHLTADPFAVVRSQPFALRSGTAGPLVGGGLINGPTIGSLVG